MGGDGMWGRLAKLARNRAGASAIEYPLLAALVSLGIVASVQATGATFTQTLHILNAHVLGVTPHEDPASEPPPEEPEEEPEDPPFCHFGHCH